MKREYRKEPDVIDTIVQAAVGMGELFSLMFSELLGASAGGIVVPGYIALYLDKPFADNRHPNY